MKGFQKKFGECYNDNIPWMFEFLICCMLKSSCWKGKSKLRENSKTNIWFRRKNGGLNSSSEEIICLSEIFATKEISIFSNLKLNYPASTKVQSWTRLKSIPTKMHTNVYCESNCNKFMGKTFQAAQLNFHWVNKIWVH